jgi:hypothetical protein
MAVVDVRRPIEKLLANYAPSIPRGLHDDEVLFTDAIALAAIVGVPSASFAASKVQKLA